MQQSYEDSFLLPLNDVYADHTKSAPLCWTACDQWYAFRYLLNTVELVEDGPMSIVIGLSSSLMSHGSICSLIIVSWSGVNDEHGRIHVSCEKGTSSVMVESWCRSYRPPRHQKRIANYCQISIWYPML